MIEGDGTDWGSWTAEKHCDRGKAICGIQTQVELEQGGRVDDTGLNNVNMKCCARNSESSTCTPTDEWEPILTCDNLDGVSDLTCSYEKTVGTTDSSGENKGGHSSNTESRSQSLEVGAAFKGLSANFRTNLEKSKTTGHNWSKESSKTWSGSRRHLAQFSAPAFTSSTLYQVVGHCGEYTVNSAHFKKVDTVNEAAIATINRKTDILEWICK